MGMCGCSAIPADYVLPGPDGSVYTVHLYQPCSYCENPGGIVLAHLTRPDDIATFAAGVPELKLEPGGTGLAVLDVRALRSLIRSQCEGLVARFDGEDEDLTVAELAEAMCDDLDRHVEKMVGETFRQVQKELTAPTVAA